MFFILLFLGYYKHKAQTKTGFSEFIWAVSHQVSAVKVKSISKKCTRVYSVSKTSAKLDGFFSGGKVDAYRHAFYMAAFAQKIKVRKIRKLGMAHEKTNYRQFKRGIKEEGELPDSLSTVMDLYNNELGFKIGSEFKNISLSELSDKVISSIGNGEALIMKRNKSGEYLDCKNKILLLEEVQGKWSNSKCLVRSDYVYID